ncbi:MAG: amidohydrolase [Anaerolineaceae bacterium]|nr:MAG: amidohydrolase [Anaerolineaceae bacterium]
MTILIKNILAIEEKDSDLYVEETSIYIENDRIVDIGNSDYKADIIIDGKNKLAIPGMINNHTHAYMSLFRNYADDLPFSQWLFDKILPLEDKLTGEDAYWGTMLGIMEMIKTGTTCFTDMYIFINETSRAVDETGIRASLSRGLVGSGDDEEGRRRINEARKEIEYWKANGNDRLSFIVAPHAPYTCDDKYLLNVIDFARDYNLGINIHLSESRNEIAEINSKYKCSPTEFLNKLGLFDLNTLAAHCVYLSDNDINILSEKNVNVVTCPVSNLKLGNGIAPISKLIDKGVNVCLGTDGAASNNTLNMFKELQFVTLIHKGIEEKADVISASTGLKFATSNAAKALGLENKIGKIKIGYKADITILDIDKPQYYPRNNLISALAYSTNGDEVSTVIVDGKILMNNNEFLTIDEEKVKYHINSISKRLFI